MKSYRLEHSLKELGFRTYSEYLKSDLWKQARAEFLERNPDCVRCGNEATQVHHVRYNIRTLKGIQTHNLVSCCSTCHREAHVASSKGSLKNELEATWWLRRDTPNRKGRRKAWKRRARDEKFAKKQLMIDYDPSDDIDPSQRSRDEQRLKKIRERRHCTRHNGVGRNSSVFT